MSRSKKKFLALSAICTAGTLLQTGLVPTSCAQYYLDSTLTALDFCAVFNCTPGTFFNLCEPVPLFWDCPNVTAGQP